MNDGDGNDGGDDALQTPPGRRLRWKTQLMPLEDHLRIVEFSPPPQGIQGQELERVLGSLKAAPGGFFRTFLPCEFLSVSFYV